MSDKNLIEAARLLGVYTAGRFDVWAMAGPAKRKCRQHVMTILVNGPDGRKIPQAKCGVTAIVREFNDRAGIDGSCIAVRETVFRQWCHDNGNGRWAFGTFDDKWHLIFPGDRDYDAAIPPAEFNELTEAERQTRYLRPAMV